MTRQKLSPKKQTIYEALSKLDVATGNEIYREMGGIGSPININLYTRLREMEHFGVVKRVGMKKCSITGNDGTAWKVGSKL